MNREELKEYLPHREPMLLVDEIEIDEEGTGYAKYLIKEDEFFCKGHFPGNPIVPGVIQLEIMAQSCALLFQKNICGKTILYTGVNNVRFKNIVRPGDLCEITTRKITVKGSIYFCQGELRVNGKLCCKGDLSFAIMAN